MTNILARAGWLVKTALDASVLAFYLLSRFLPTCVSKRDELSAFEVTASR